ncbi:hypothetical protein [Halarcobacter sp.]|uniref:hypothetical protein n=1 Tax=Halarcobacter sp. TaxID=2321133 RepID=UPI002AA70164|nr:hypothetical protein [Halarcobacter sp.]
MSNLLEFTNIEFILYSFFYLIFFLSFLFYFPYLIYKSYVFAKKYGWRNKNIKEKDFLDETPLTEFIASVIAMICGFYIFIWENGFLKFIDSAIQFLDIGSR